MTKRRPLRTWMAASCLSALLLPANAFAADDARDLLKAMSDFMGKQKTFSFDYDSTIEVVTPDFQKLQFASSGNVAVSRPDKIKVNRTGGFSDIEFAFDGTTLSLLGRNLNAYAQVEAKGTLDDLAEKLENAGIEPPGADLLSSDIYDLLIDDDVTDAKHISSAYVDGVECELLAFRARDVDWQIWIRGGDQPVPLRYVITSKHVAQAPQYTLQIRDWKLGTDAATAALTFDKPADAKKVDLSELPHIDEIPEAANVGDAQ